MEEQYVSYDDFSRLDLRVAEIVSVKEHPNADKLYVLDIKIGDMTKQIIAGIRLNYTKEDLTGRKIIVVNNLAHAVIRGEESQGMLLAASGNKGPVILMPEKDVPSGARVK